MGFTMSSTACIFFFPPFISFLFFFLLLCIAERDFLVVQNLNSTTIQSNPIPSVISLSSPRRSSQLFARSFIPSCPTREMR